MKKCSKCGGDVVTKTHNFNSEKDRNKLKKQKCHFTQWDYCLKCHTQWYQEKYRVWTDAKAKRIHDMFEEKENQMSFLSLIK